jgi:acetyl esterase/lipase
MASEQVQAMIAMFRSQPIASPDATIADNRAGFEQTGDLYPVPDDVRRESVIANGVPAEWIVPPGVAEDRAILFLHGGGYCIGSIHTHRDLTARLARASGARALLIDYRLAPEHSFPAAVEDAAAAYRWLLGQGVAPERMVIAGDSAGGGLTIATLVYLRYTGAPMPAAGVCLSPWVDLDGTGPSMSSNADVDPIVQREGLKRMAAAYLGGANPGAPLASPLYADLAGLPPLFIQVGGAEALLDDSTRLTERARAAGVSVTLEIWPELFHVWQGLAPMLPESTEAVDRLGAFIRAHTGGGSVREMLAAASGD